MLILEALIGIKVPVAAVADTHRIDVAVKADQRLAGAHEAHDISLGIHLHLIKANLLHLRLDGGHMCSLLSGLARILHDGTKECGHIRLIALGCCLDLLQLFLR